MIDPIEIVKASLRNKACEHCQAVDPSIAAGRPCPRGARIVLNQMQGATLMHATSMSLPDDEPLVFSRANDHPVVFQLRDAETVFEEARNSLTIPIARCADSKIVYDSRAVVSGADGEFEPLTSYSMTEVTQLLGKAAATLGQGQTP